MVAVKRVYSDTNLFIYLFDVHSPFYPLAQTLLERLFAGDYQLTASLYVLGELLVYPARSEDIFSAARIRRFFSNPAVQMAQFDKSQLTTFVDLRTKGVKSLDALHLATAAGAEVDLFITNDHKLLTLTVPGIGQIIGLDEAIALL